MYDKKQAEEAKTTRSIYGYSDWGDRSIKYNESVCKININKLLFC